jgi:hypothetical protein
MAARHTDGMNAPPPGTQEEAVLLVGKGWAGPRNVSAILFPLSCVPGLRAATREGAGAFPVAGRNVPNLNRQIPNARSTRRRWSSWRP